LRGLEILKGSKMEKRHHPRVEIKNISVDASDGVGFFHGVISDASRCGVCVTDLQKKMDVEVKQITVVVSGHGQHFKMNVRPRWSTHNGLNKSIGAEILNAPWGWTEFIMKFEPEKQQNIWDIMDL
jgi:hypothetical protein